jgi:PAS domain S-box-containing protein
MMKKKFSDLAGYLVDQLNADCLVIATVDDPEHPKWAQTLKVYADGEYLENFLYSLEKAPCQTVVESHACVYPEFVQEIFPDYELLKRLDIEGYAGVSLFNDNVNANGILVALFKSAIQDPEEVRATLETFSHWASAEVNRIEAEMALRESEARFRAVFDLSPDAVVISMVDNGTILDVNETFIENLGYSRAEVIGKSTLDLGIWVNPEIRAELVDLIKGDSATDNIETLFRRKDETTIHGLASFKIVKFNSKPCLLTTVKDIGKQKKTEKALRESEERFRTVFELNPDVIAITKVDDGSFVDVNDAFSQTTGFDRGEVIGRSILGFNLWSSSEARDEFVSNIMENGFIHNAEFRLNRKDGKSIDGLLSSRTINLDGEPHLLTIVKDITEQKQAQVKIRKSLDEKEILLREIHHRVKNNMQVITSLLSLQARQADDEYVKELFEKSQSRILSMSLVHEQLYQSEDFTHICFQNYLEKLVNNVADSYAVDVRHITATVDASNLDLSIDSFIPCGLIVTELVSNAYKYAFPSGKYGIVSIKAYKDDDDMINLKIEDNGRGIPKFIDLRKMESLGLKLVYMLAEHQLSGKVEVDRTKGTQFHIRFKDTRFVEEAG